MLQIRKVYNFINLIEALGGVFELFTGFDGIFIMSISMIRAVSLVGKLKKIRRAVSHGGNLMRG